MNCSITCQSVQSQMADFSAGQLSSAQAKVFEAHCSSCAICRNEWETFQNTLQLLSVLPQALPCEQLSHEMWDCCCQDWMSHVEERRCKTSRWNALRHPLHWINEQPRWAQSCWAASSVVATGVVVLWCGAWLASYKAPLDSSVVGSEIVDSKTVPSKVVASNISVVPDAPLTSETGHLRLLGQSQINASALRYPSPSVGIGEAAISPFPSRRVNFDGLPFPVSSGDYWNNQQPLPVERFIHRVGNAQFGQMPAAVRDTRHSSITPFVLEGRVKENQMPLRHGE